MSGFGLHLKHALGSGSGGGAIASVAAWVLNMLGLGQGNGSTSTTNNGTVSVIANTDAVTDGFTIVEIPDAEDIGIQNGAQLNTTTWQYSYTTQDGTNTKLALTQGLQTDNGTVETLVPMISWQADYDLTSDAQKMRLETTEGIDVHVEYGDRLGSELYTPFTSIGTGWTDNLDGTYTSDGSNGNINVDLSLLSGTNYEHVLTVSGRTTGSCYVLQGGDVAGTARLANGTFIQTLDGGTNGLFYVVGQAGFDGTIKIQTLKQVLRTDSTQPTTSISDIGGSAITDNDTSYLVKGYQTVEGLFSGLEDLPRTATVTSDTLARTGLLANDQDFQVSFEASVVGIEQWLFGDATAGLYISAANRFVFTDGTLSCTGVVVTVAADTVYTVVVSRDSTLGRTITVDGVLDKNEAGQTGDITWGDPIYQGSKGATLQLSGNIIEARVV